MSDEVDFDPDFSEIEENRLFHLVAGAGAAIILGMMLVPLREFTSASNLSFPFIALTIAVAALGGRRAAIGTALFSSLSLDFFLTTPYLDLRIAEKHDIIAFGGLTVCGLVAAAFGTENRRRSARMAAEERRLALLGKALRDIAQPGGAVATLMRTLESTLAPFHLAAAVVRDGRGEVVVATHGAADREMPVATLRFDSLLAPGTPDRRLRWHRLPLPSEGGRLLLSVGRRVVGSLDLWGTGEPLDARSRRTLSDLARLIGILLVAVPHAAQAPVTTRPPGGGVTPTSPDAQP